MYLFTNLILSILIKVERQDSAHFPTNDGPKHLVPFPVDALDGAVTAHQGQVVVLSEWTHYNNVHPVLGFLEEQVRVVVDVVSWEIGSKPVFN